MRLASKPCARAVPNTIAMDGLRRGEASRIHLAVGMTGSIGRIHMLRNCTGLP